MTATTRQAELRRESKETRIELELQVDGDGKSEIDVGIPFFEHLLDSWARHGGFGLRLRCEGDLEVDDHHSVEDVAIVLGRAFEVALGEKRGVRRFGAAYAPLDEALVRCVVDLSGRPFARVELPLRQERIGTMSTQNVAHFFRSFAMEARLTLHLDVLHGENDHHMAEAAIKAMALALREAVSRRAGDEELPSTKGILR
jgi:imidazoleglycerol-phosphate dehydratase